MSRHHNTRHDERGRSTYLGRLIRRGLNKAPAMEPVERLRERQLRRLAKTGSLWPTGKSDQIEEVEQEQGVA